MTDFYVSNRWDTQLVKWVGTRSVYHTFIWVFYIATTLILRWEEALLYNDILLIMTHIMFVMALVYINYLILFPRFFATKKIILFILSAFVLIITISPLEIILHYFLVADNPQQQLYILDNMWRYYFSFFIFVIISTLLKTSTQWFRQQRIQLELERKNLQSELAFLRSQINPHFLFNTLNSVYALSLKESKETPEAILKLSELLRYMLYKCNEKEVALSSEIEYIQNYFDLEKLRYHEDVRIQFLTNLNEDQQIKIAPLLFTPFLENAIKHGLNQPLGPAFIECSLSVEQNVLNFSISNSLSNSGKDYMDGGIGLTNIKRRLELIYPNKHQLSIQKEKNKFVVHLILNLQEE